MADNPEKPASLPEDVKKLEDYIQSIADKAEGGETLRNKIVKGLISDAEFDANEIRDLHQTILDRLLRDPNAPTDKNEIVKIADALPRDNESLLDFAYRLKFLTHSQMIAAARNAERNKQRSQEEQISPSPSDTRPEVQQEPTEDELLKRIFEAEEHSKKYEEARLQIVEQFGGRGARGVRTRRSMGMQKEMTAQIKQLRANMGNPTAIYWKARKDWEQKTGRNYFVDKMRAHNIEPGVPVQYEKKGLPHDWAHIDQMRSDGLYRDTYLRDKRTEQLMGWSPGTMQDLKRSGRTTEGFNRWAINNDRTDLIDASRMSYYTDNSGADTADFNSQGRGNRGGDRFEQGDYISRMGGNAYLREQNRLGMSYVPELFNFVENNIHKYKDDPAYSSIMGAYNRAVGRWERDPGRAYGDLAWVRSQIHEMEKRQARAEANIRFASEIRDPETGEIKSIKSLNVRPLNGMSFDPGERVRIVIPKNSPGFNGTSDLVIDYEPFTELGVQSNQEWELLKRLGVYIQKEKSELSTYATGVSFNRPRVMSLNFHFTKPIDITINGNPVHIGEDGVEKKNEQLENIVGQGTIDFGRLTPRIVEITGEDGTKISFDVSRLEVGTTVVRDDSFSIKRLSNKQFLVQTNKSGVYAVTGFEHRAGRGWLRWALNTRSGEKSKTSATPPVETPKKSDKDLPPAPPITPKPSEKPEDADKKKESKDKPGLPPAPPLTPKPPEKKEEKKDESKPESSENQQINAQLGIDESAVVSFPADWKKGKILKVTVGGKSWAEIDIQSHLTSAKEKNDAVLANFMEMLQDRNKFYLYDAPGNDQCTFENRSGEEVSFLLDDKIFFKNTPRLPEKIAGYKFVVADWGDSKRFELHDGKDIVYFLIASEKGWVLFAPKVDDGNTAIGVYEQSWQPPSGENVWFESFDAACKALEKKIDGKKTLADKMREWDKRNAETIKKITPYLDAPDSPTVKRGWKREGLDFKEIDDRDANHVVASITFLRRDTNYIHVKSPSDETYEMVKKDYATAEDLIKDAPNLFAKKELPSLASLQGRILTEADQKVLYERRDEILKLPVDQIIDLAEHLEKDLNDRSHQQYILSHTADRDIRILRMFTATLKPGHGIAGDAKYVNVPDLVEKFLEGKPNDAKVLREAGICYLNTYEREKALSYFEKALAAGDEISGIALYAAYVEDEPERAREYLMKARAIATPDQKKDIDAQLKLHDERHKKDNTQQKEQEKKKEEKKEETEDDKKKMEEEVKREMEKLNGK